MSYAVIAGIASVAVYKLLGFEESGRGILLVILIGLGNYLIGFYAGQVSE